MTFSTLAVFLAVALGTVASFRAGSGHLICVSSGSCTVLSACRRSEKCSEQAIERILLSL